MWFFYTIITLFGLGFGNFPLAIIILLFVMFMRERWNSVADYDLHRSRINLEREFARQQAKREKSSGSRSYMSGGEYYFYNMNKLSEDDYRYEYIKHLIRIAAAIISVDKKIHPKEMDTLMSFVEKLGFNEDNLKKIKEEIDKALIDEIFIPGECEYIRKFMRRQDRFEFIRLLFIIATSDRGLTKLEEQIIGEVSFDLYISEYDYRSIRAEFRPRYDSNYEILGVPESADIKEIKLAYKQLVRKNHPDKFVHLGQKFAVHATEKLKKINAAYASIKHQRGF